MKPFGLASFKRPSPSSAFTTLLQRRSKKAHKVHSLGSTGTREWMVVVADGDNSATSPLTSSSGATATTTMTTSSKGHRRRSRKSPRQETSEARLDAKMVQDDLNNQYSLAFKEATVLRSSHDKKCETADEIIQ